MMPPIANSLGPITDWLSSRRIGALRAKYEDFSRASSAVKVHCYAFSAVTCAPTRTIECKGVQSSVA